MNQKLFYPMRFKQNRPYMGRFVRDLEDLRIMGGLNPSTAFNASARSIMEALMQDGAGGAPTDKQMHDFTLENMNALVWAQWFFSQAQIYAFDAHLVEAFAQSDASEIQIKDLHFPFENVYFHLGVQHDLPLHKGLLWVEGAYVMFTPESLRIVLAGEWDPKRVPESERGHSWLERAQECYNLRIPGAYYGEHLGVAIEKALTDDKADIVAALEKAVLVSEDARTAGKALILAHETNSETYRKALNLIANGLCYLTAYPHDVLSQWPQNTPVKLKGRTESGTPKEKKRALSKLHALGFSIINEVGTRFGEQTQHKPPMDRSDGDAVQLRAHWRKGHWRHQAYGPKSGLRKLKWIMPVYVGSTWALEDRGRVHQIRG